MNLFKRIIFGCCFLFYHENIFSQALVDSSYKTTYYEQKVTMFGLIPNEYGEIIFLGDSITDIAEWSEIWNNIHVKNRGISSDNTFGVLARLDEVLSSKPAKVFIMIGINDISKDTPDSVIISNYKKIISRVKRNSPKTKLYVQSILPTNNEFTEFKRHQNKMDHIKFVNEALRQICNQEKIFYVDLFAAFIDEKGKLNKKYTNDGLHINGYGYMKWTEVLMKKGFMK